MNAMQQTTRSHKTITALFLVVVILFSTFNSIGLPSARARQAGTESLSGWLSIIRGESQDGSVYKEIHMLATENGQSVQLVLDESATAAAGGLLALDRKHITVHGDWAGALTAQSGPQTFQVTSTDPLPEADVTSAAVTGTKKWISIMCKFPDIATEPRNIAYFQGMYGATSPGMDHYWREQSYNLMNTVGSTAAGWYTLSHPFSYYKPSQAFDITKAAQDCTAAANASVNFSTYYGINLMFNSPNLDCCAWGGGAYLALDGPAKVWPITWLPQWGYENIAVTEHEMGHAFGLPHSSGNYNKVYDNEWDVMSDTWTACYNRAFSNPFYGCLGQHTISYHKDKLGWVPAGQKFTPASGSSTNLLLEQFALPQTNDYKMVKIPIAGSSTRFYTVEARRFAGYDSGLAGQGVIIHEVDTNRSSAPAHVIDIDNNGTTGDAGAIWSVGEVFRDNVNKVAIAVLGSTATGFQVNVTLNKSVYYISGNAGAGDVTINYTGGSTTSASNGMYIFSVPAGWSGTVTPSKPGYTFSPANRSYANVAADFPAQNFAATPFYSISGNVGAAGVTLSYTISGTPQTVISDVTGNYALYAPGGWTGLVTPSHFCYNFSPANLGYSNLASDQTDQNYTPAVKAAAGCADITTWVGELKRGRFGLASGASTRASFAGVNEGAVEVVGDNGVPLIAAERVVYKVNGVNTSFSEMMALPAGQLDTTYWLPWYNNVELDTQLRFGNTNNTTATVLVYVGGVEMPGGAFTIAKYGSARKSYVGINDGPVRVVSSLPIAVSERVVFKVNGVNTSFTELMALPNAHLDTTYWLPWYNNVELNTQLRFANVSGSQATVHVYIGGAEMSGSPFTLEVDESTRKSFPGINNGPVKIESDVPIVAAERVVYKVNGVDTSFSEMMGLPAGQLDTTYWLPWYNNVELDTQLRIANASTATATVHVYVGGVEMAGSPFDLAVGESTRKSFPGVSNGPVRIVSNQNIVAAERVVYKVNGVNTSFTEMMGLQDSFLHPSNWLPHYNNVDLDTQLRFAVP